MPDRPPRATTPTATTPSATVRPATPADAAELVRLRRLMFEAMGYDLADDAWEEPARRQVHAQLASGELLGVVVDHPDASAGEARPLVAGGLVGFDRHLPGPGWPDGTQGYLSSICTEPSWRGRGLGRLVAEALVAAAEDRGVRRLHLHATDGGAALYRSLGFVERAENPEMLRRRPGEGC